MGISNSKLQKMLIIISFCVLLTTFFKVVGSTQCPCKESKCSDDGPPIHFPFRLKDRHPDHCGRPGFVVSCNDRHETVLELPNIPVNFSVATIGYENQTIQVNDSDNCLPVKLSKIVNMSVSPFEFYFSYYGIKIITFINCSVAGTTSGNHPWTAVPCLSSPSHQIYAVDSWEFIGSIQGCTKMYDNLSAPIFWHWNNSYNSEVESVELIRKSGGCGANATTKLVAASGSASLVLLLLIIAVYKFYTYDRNERENRLKIETFLEDYQAFKPSRYSYEDIKRITNQFKDRLGQGSYGTVFKGKLSSELFVAVKVLKISNGNGEEFINEVGTLGHIHHVNVVRLVGFCSDGSRRALVYEFLPNGSLHDYISSDNQTSFLGWDKLQSIALGVAKGIEYLHQGCDQRIMHFDIKPHNVLLDQNFTPKLSDFGLAKLCSKDQSIVSMTTARGTMGYIAPEVFSRNFGNVSYKSDVYSFGMVLLEMVGGSATRENTNEVYYPELVYNLLERGEGPRIHIVEERDAKIQRKIAIIGLWCIQWNPVDRPSMKVVVQMLEGEENLTIPPNPYGSTSDPARNLHPPLETIVELA